MGSKKRITNKLRQNDEYRAITKFLDAVGLRFTTHGPTGSQHPFLIIDLPDGRELRHSVACTPSGGGFPKKALSHLKRQLRASGYDVG